MRFEYFQMVDRIVALDAEARLVRSHCVVPQQSTVFEGHFPTYPLMPGALLLECMAQTTGWLVMARSGFTAMPFLIGVRDAKFRTPVMPGDELEFEGGIVHEGSGFTVGECKGRRKGKAVCEAQITYRVMAFPSPEFRRSILQWAEQIDVSVKEFIK
jgi:3-hydroxyacyl-[acyl-carrier-protein] dehydratase